MATLQNLIDAVDNLEDSVSDLSSQVNIRKANLDSAIASAQGSRNQAATSATQAATSATQAATSAAQAASAAGQATQVAMGQATGIAGIIPSARIRANSSFLNPEFRFLRSLSSQVNFFDRNFQYSSVIGHTPRFEYDPITGQALGILTESSSTNLITNSNDFAANAWSFSRLNFTVGSSSLGFLSRRTSWNFIETAGGSSNIKFQQTPLFTTVSGQIHTFSMYVKPLGRTVINIYADNDTAWGGFPAFRFDLTNATSTRISGTNGTSHITILPDGWFRCEINVLAAASVSNARFQFRLLNSALQESYVGDGISGISVFGAQAEVSPRATSYIETGNSQVTRPSEVLELLTQFWNPEEGTIIARVRTNIESDQNVFLASNNTGNQQFQIRTSGVIRFRFELGQEQQIQTGTSGIGNWDIWVVSYTRTRISASRNGGPVLSMNIDNTRPFNSFRLESTSSSGIQSKNIHTLQYSRKALTDAQLIVRSNPATFFGFENGDVALNADLGDAAFMNVNAIQRLPGRLDMPFFGTGSNQSYTFRLDFDCEVRDLFTTGSTFTRPTPGTTILRDTNITVTHNAPVGTVMILSFLPIIQ